MSINISVKGFYVVTRDDNKADLFPREIPEEVVADTNFWLNTHSQLSDILIKLDEKS